MRKASIKAALADKNDKCHTASCCVDLVYKYSSSPSPISTTILEGKRAETP
jgi:hypothetical protein